MSTAVVDAPSHLMGGPEVATALIGTNTRVRGQPGLLGTVLDQITFPAGQGRMSVGSSRVRVGGVPVLPSSAVGQYVPNSGAATAPIVVVQGDSRVRAR